MPSTTQDLYGSRLEQTTQHLVVPSCNLGRPPTNPPTVDIYGICQVLEFTVGTDKAYYKLHVPIDWAPGTGIKVHAHWTRSSTGADDSGKTVKWQMKYLAVDGRSENVNSGESTLSVQDTYDSSDVNDQIAYATDDVTIPASAIAAGDCIVIELMAVAPTGTALSDPACAALGITFINNRVVP